MYAPSSLKAALLAGFIATTNAFDCSGPYFSFYNRGGSSMSYQSLDPALNPGVKATHLHSFDGGNVISSSMGFADTQQATCTTNRIKPDKSLYWRPTLFWNGNNTGYYRVPDRFVKIYYKFGDSGNVKAAVSEFPEDFMMIAGQNNLRSDDGVVGTHNGPQLMWSCMGENYQRIDAVGFPKGFTSCKEGLASQLTFPACWNGNSINPEKPYDHMAYPTANGKGIDACPDGFKEARFPTIFIEFWYDVSSFDGQYDADSVPWVLSNGDPTGYGFHADFMNGWEKGVLAKATGDSYLDCGCGCGNDQMKQYFGAENVNDDQDLAFKQCAATPEFPGEDSLRMDELPGCNPIQAGPAPATKVNGENCGGGVGTAPAQASSTSAVVNEQHSPAPVPTGLEPDRANDETPDAPYPAEPIPTTDAAGQPPTSTIDSDVQPTAIAEDEQEQGGAITFQLPSSSAHAVVVPSPNSPAPSNAAAELEEPVPNQPSPASEALSSPVASSALSPDGGVCVPAVTTITTKNVVTVTVTPSPAAPTGIDECGQLATVFTTVKEIVTVTVAPDAAYGKMKRHVAAHRHHVAAHGR